MESKIVLTSKKFDTVDEIINDEYFQMFLDKNIDKLRSERNNRPPTKPGFRYKRDWYDRMCDDNNFNIRFFINNITDIWIKKSSLSSEIRSVIEFICNKSLQQTYQKYNETKKMNEIK